jgi:hypothetical protein
MIAHVGSTEQADAHDEVVRRIERLPGTDEGVALVQLPHEWISPPMPLSPPVSRTVSPKQVLTSTTGRFDPSDAARSPYVWYATTSSGSVTPESSANSDALKYCTGASLDMVGVKRAR